MAASSVWIVSAELHSYSCDRSSDLMSDGEPGATTHAPPHVPAPPAAGPRRDAPATPGEPEEPGEQADRRGAIDRLYARHARMVYAVALGIVSRAEAEDAVQDVFVKAMHRLGELRDESRAGAWLAAIARTVAIDRHRARSREHRTMDGMKHDPRTAPDPAGPGAAALEAGDVLDTIRRMPEAYREPLLLRLVEGMTGPQIAEQLGMTHGSVRVNLCQGMQQLRQRLGREGAS